MLKPKPFKGANVFMSRNLVVPEVFDALLDALKLNGAEIFLCCDPSRNGPSDFHIISSPNHEKFNDLRAKSCNLLGPQCVLSCAKENRAFPRQGYTCCLAMDGVKVLASGFDVNEKAEIEMMVNAMGGQLLTKASLDVSFVIVKNVLAAKYKWALNILKKPIVTITWLHQCWNEHRVVPKESYRVLPFLGLTICVTRILADERKEVEKLIKQNGGRYSPELTKSCTHLISDISSTYILKQNGDKYKVARRWGHIHIVTRKWFDQSVERRACLNEESYPVQEGCASLNKIVRGPSKTQHSQDSYGVNLLSAPSSVATESNISSFQRTGFLESDLDVTVSQNMSSMFADPSAFIKEEDGGLPKAKAACETSLDGCVANDSQSEDGDLYLSECRISLVGFEASELRKLVNMVRQGGGSRYMAFSDRLTHIVIGAPSEAEKKELRKLAASGVVNVVRIKWLEDCDREKKEVPVLHHHIAYDLLLPQDSMGSIRGPVAGVTGMNQSKISSFNTSNHTDHLVGSTNSGNEMVSSLEKNMNGAATSVEMTARRSLEHIFPSVNNQKRAGKKVQQNSGDQSVQNGKSIAVFKGKTFRFSKSFPEDRRSEIVQWVGQGGGEVVNDYISQNVNFVIECHGTISRSMHDRHAVTVSSHWIRSCLEDGCLLDVATHIIYSPLPCWIPLPGFENFRFCVSQYEEKERLLLRNLCFVLGAKFVEKLTKKVTHLLCKFTNGPKYEAACKWGIRPTTSEWIFECVRQNQVVALDPFHPKDVTSQDQEAGLCTVSQFPTQAVQMISADNPSQFISQSQDLRKEPAQIGCTRLNKFREEEQQSADCTKKARLLGIDDQKDLISSRVDLRDPLCKASATESSNSRDNGESSHCVPDVAAAIEDLLEQTRKIHDQKSPARTPCDKTLFSSDCSMLGEDHGSSPSVIGLTKSWLNRTGRRDESSNPAGDEKGRIYDNFSETQTESQVVGYEEDLSGRQMLIDRVRTRSSMA